MTGFPTTRWSLVLGARAPDASSRDALERLCASYRPPVLAFVRRHVHAADAAEDLTQAFFLHFVERAWHDVADPERGRFRNFLLTAVRRFIGHAQARDATLKRGGAAPMQSYDALAEQHDVADATPTPDAAFDQAWAIALVQAALARLREEAAAAGKTAMFERLSEFLVEAPDDGNYQVIADELGMRRGTLAVAVHRLRGRLRELVREELEQTIANAEDLERERKDLRHVLGGVV